MIIMIIIFFHEFIIIFMIMILCHWLMIMLPLQGQVIQVPGQPGARSATPQTIVLPHHHYFYIYVSLNSQRHYHTPDPQKIIPMIGPLKRKQNEYMSSPLFWSLKLKLGPSPGAIGIARLPLLLSYDAQSRTSQR